MGERLTAGDLCTRDVIFAYRQTPIDEAARLMRSHHVGCLAVVDETADGRIVSGMLTDRDIVVEVVAPSVAASSLRVEDVMSSDLVTAREDDSVADLLASMRHKGVRRVPVVGAKGELVGLVAADDLLEVFAQELHTLVQAITAQAGREQRTRP